MSREVFIKNQIKSLLASSKTDTATKFSTLNAALEDMFGQVNDELVSLRNSVGLFYTDAEGYVCQRITEEEEEGNNE
ncbi:MAG: hypothetical protein IJ859_00105 [Synergistaceae bacterium]|nr:hypothetical protein [Synergistaceae bacterium]